MNPKEKAKELVHRMYNTEHCGIKHFPNKNYCDCVEINLFQAKQCALIAVDETISTLNLLLKSGLNNDFDVLGVRGYYMEVKQEIERI